KPVVEFKNTRLDVGDFLNDLIGPTIERIQSVLAPLQPFVDVLLTPIPGVSDLAKIFLGREVSPIDIAILFDVGGAQEAKVFLEAVQEILAFTDVLDSVGAGTYINFGDFRFDSDLRQGTSPPPNQVTTTPPAQTPLQQLESKTPKLSGANAG